jgi:hypothetical protein
MRPSNSKRSSRTKIDTAKLPFRFFRLSDVCAAPPLLDVQYSMRHSRHDPVHASNPHSEESLCHSTRSQSSHSGRLRKLPKISTIQLAVCLSSDLDGISKNCRFSPDSVVYRMGAETEAPDNRKDLTNSDGAIHLN